MRQYVQRLLIGEKNNMNNTIEALNKKLENLNKNIIETELELQNEYNKILAQDSDLKQAIEKLESSNEYGIDESGIYQWIRYVYKGKVPIKALEYYLNEQYCIIYNTEYDTLQAYCGPTIQIYYNGNVYCEDSNKVIIENTKYNTIRERNNLIEKYMQKTGYYPGVFEVDRYNNVKLVNTKGE